MVCWYRYAHKYLPFPGTVPGNENLFQWELVRNNCSQELFQERRFPVGNPIPGTFPVVFPGMFLGNISHFPTAFVRNSYSQEKREYSQWEHVPRNTIPTCSHLFLGIFLERSQEQWEHFLGIVPRNVPGIIFPVFPLLFPGTWEQFLGQ